VNSPADLLSLAPASMWLCSGDPLIFVVSITCFSFELCRAWSYQRGNYNP
jgi:hypothetical protein